MTFLLPFVSVLLGFFAFPPFGAYPLGFVFIAPLFVFFLREKSVVKVLLGTFMFRIILLTAVTYFVFDPIIFILSTLLFLGLPLSFFALKKYANERVVMALLPLLWTFWDHTAARYSLLPFFGLTAGNIFGSSPFLGIAGIGGLTALTFFASVINALAAYACMRNKKSDAKQLFLSLLMIIIVVGAGWGISALEIQKNSEAYQDQSRRLVAAAISANEKFDEEYALFPRDTFTNQEKELVTNMIARTLEPIRSDLRGKKLDLIVFPEDMIDVELWNDADTEAKEKFGISNAGALIRAYRGVAQESHANVLATFTTLQNGKRYNSTLLFNREGALIDYYRKSRLSIAGEYWPFGDWIPFYYRWLRRIAPDVGQDSALFNERYRYQKGEQKIVSAPDFTAATPICIEAHYPGLIKKFKEMGAEFIVHTSSNRWVTLGLNNYLEITDNVRKIEAVWLRMPFLINGRKERAGVIAPDGRHRFVHFEGKDKNYGIFIGEL